MNPTPDSKGSGSTAVRPAVPAPSVRPSGTSVDVVPDGSPGPAAPAAGPVLEVRDLTTTFGVREGDVLAVRSVSFEVHPGQTVVLLGESGSGKSVTARSVMRLHGGRAKVTGSVSLAGTSLLDLSEAQMRAVRGARIAMVPQDPSGSLDPLRRIGAQIAEVLRVHGRATSKAAARERAVELLRSVGIPDPGRVVDSYPHELSGGMRQRVVIAMAISCDPDVIIADEPTTALDVTVQAQILELFAELQQRLSTALLMVTHDVGVASDVADVVAVMYAGSIVEFGPAREVLDTPRHPYTRALLSALPTPGVPRGELRAIPGAPPVAGEHFGGCAFATRCDAAVPSCSTAAPALVDVAPGRKAACPVLNPVVDVTEVPA